MAKDVPILLDQQNIRQWRVLCDAGEKRPDSRFKMRKPEVTFDKVRDEILAMPHPDPALLIKLARTAHEDYPDRFSAIIDAIETKTIQGNSRFLMEIADILLDHGDSAHASAFMGRVEEMTDLCRYEYELGRIDVAEGRESSAQSHFMRAFLTDPSFIPVYARLNQLDGTYGWLHLKNIMLLLGGAPADLLDSVAQTAGLGELFSDCKAWYTGNKTDAMAAIKQSISFKTGDPVFHTAYARMCIAMGLYQNARDSIEVARGHYPDSELILLLSAQLFRIMGDYASSAKCRAEATKYNPKGINILKERISSLANQGLTHELNMAVEALLSSDGADAGCYTFCIDTYVDHGYDMNAFTLLRKLEARCTDEVTVWRAIAKYGLSAGDDKKALSFAKKALDREPEDAALICIKARAMIRMKKDDAKIEKEIKKVLDKEPMNKMALSTMVELHMRSEHYNEALVACDHILGFYPNEADIMRQKAEIYAILGKRPESLDAYRLALNMREDTNLFISIIENLLRENLIDDLVRFVDDYDDIYGNISLVWRIRGNAEYKTERFEDASVSFGKATMLSVNDSEAWHSKGLSEEAAGMYRDAEASYDHAILMDLDNNDYWISKATVQERQGDYKGAVDSINKVLRSSSTDVYALVMKAKLLVKANMPREAQYFLEEALKLSPANREIQGMRIAVYEHERDYENAIAVCKQVLIRDSGDVPALISLAKAYAGANPANKDLAIYTADNAAMKAPDSFDAMMAKVEVYHILGDKPNEIDACKPISEKFPENRGIKVRMAELYAELGDSTNAAKIYNELEGGDEDEASILIKKAEVESEAEEHMTQDDVMKLVLEKISHGCNDEAETLLKKILGEGCDTPDPYLMFIPMALENGRKDEALDAARDAIGRFTGDPRIMQALGDCERALGDYNSAYGSYSDAVSAGMSTSEIFDSLGCMQEELGQSKQAIDSYSKSLTKEPNRERPKIGLARLLLKENRIDEAETVLDELILSGVTGAEVLKMRTRVYVGKNDSEGLLSLYDLIRSKTLDDEDKQFFMDSFTAVGKMDKAESLFVPDETVEEALVEPRATEETSVDEEMVEKSQTVDEEIADETSEEPQVIEDPATEEATEESLSVAIDATDAEITGESQSMDEEPVVEESPVAEEATEEDADEEPFNELTIDTSSDIFNEMESLSYEVVVDGGLKDIENDQDFSDELVEANTGLSDPQDVLTVRQYIDTVLRIKVEPVAFHHIVEEVVNSIDGDESLYEIMALFDVGLYTARVAREIRRINNGPCPSS